MKSKKPTVEECYEFGNQLARILSDAYHKKYGHVKMGDFEVHHYLLFFAIPLFDDNCMKAFLAGAAMDDIADLVDAIFPDIPFTRKVSDSIREYQGRQKHHT